MGAEEVRAKCIFFFDSGSLSRQRMLKGYRQLQGRPVAGRTAVVAECPGCVSQVEALPEEDARYHLQRCEDSGLWVPSQQAQSILRELY